MTVGRFWARTALFAGACAITAYARCFFLPVPAPSGSRRRCTRDERAALLVELAAEKAEAAARAELFEAIIDSSAEGLVVIDESGRVVLRNPAATRLLGGQRSPDGTLASAAFYGLHRLDGTPLDERMMTRVAEIGDIDLLVRNPGVPEGRIIRVRATPLDTGGSRRSVVLFHDVTAERRQRDELACFAGVVAHDLLTPVTTVDGWGECAREALDDLPDGPAVARVRDSLCRMGRASRRMRTLIIGLLAYATATDATITAVPVDLNAMVTEVTVARLDAAAAAGKPVPRFSVGDLPAVRADPMLLRQVLDNLIGNAVKYTAAGVTPVLAITADRDGDLVRVTITDNGIGIPAGQHEAVFARFHRAHTAEGYAGTGLGLGICKRIVERHGGTITAAGNAGGGSRLTFTVPVAAVPGGARGPEPVTGSAQIR